MKSFLNITSALSDANRVRILLALGGVELCVCQMIELLGLAPSTVSKHLSILRQADLIEVEKTGRWMNYRLADRNGASPAVREALRWVRTLLAGDEQARRDAKHLKAILKEDPEELCRRQCGRGKCEC